MNRALDTRVSVQLESDHIAMGDFMHQAIYPRGAGLSRNRLIGIEAV